MNKKIIFSLIAIMLMLLSEIAVAYDSGDLNRRLRNCTPTKDYNAGGSTVYQISGLTGSTCIYKIEHYDTSKQPNLICKVPYAKMYEMTSYNPLTVQRLRSKYCVMSMKSLDKTKRVY